MISRSERPLFSQSICWLPFFCVLTLNGCSTHPSLSVEHDVSRYIKERNLCSTQHIPAKQITELKAILEKSYTYRVANAKPILDTGSPNGTEDRSKDTPLKKETSIQLSRSDGDRFPSITVPDTSNGSKTIRLEPFMRRANLHAISRIAVSPDMRRVALIALRNNNQAPVVLEIDSESSGHYLHDLEAYDLAWSSNSSLLATRLIAGKPRELYYLTKGNQPSRVHSVSDPSSELLLTPTSSFKPPLITVLSPTQASIFSFDDARTPRLKPVLENDTPGAQCSFWGENLTCLSYHSNASGEVYLLKDSLKTRVTQGSPRQPIVAIDGDQEHLKVFSSSGTATTLTIFKNPSERPVELPPLGPVTTLSPSHIAYRDGRKGITARSFLLPTRTLSLEDLLQKPARSTAMVPSHAPEFIEESINIPSADGTLIPVSLITPPHHRGLVVHTYGAYGQASFAEYTTFTQTLLAQGIALAIVHVRGGGELGPGWHSAGRAPYKHRAVDDLISAVRALQQRLNIPPTHTILRGRSAGAWLVTRVALEAPSDVSAIIIDAPLLNLTAATSDPLSPLLYRDQIEWGSPSAAAELSVAPLPTTTQFPLSVLMILPMRDELIPVEEALQWAIKARCAQPLGQLLEVVTLPTAAHIGPTNASDALILERAQLEFINQVMTRLR